MRRDSHYSLLQLVLNIIKWSWNQLWNKWYALLASYCWTVRTYWYSHHNNRPNLCFKAKLSAKPLIWKWSFILMQMKPIIARKVLHLASVWKWEFLELGNCLFAFCSLRIQYRDQMWLESIQLKISVLRTCNFFILENFSKIIIQYVYFFSFYRLKPSAFRGGSDRIFS